jgi:hypothetical protein
MWKYLFGCSYYNDDADFTMLIMYIIIREEVTTSRHEDYYAL